MTPDHYQTVLAQLIAEAARFAANIPVGNNWK